MVKLFAFLFAVVVAVIVAVVRNNKKTVSKFVSAEEAKILADASKAESAVVSEVKTKI